MSLESLYKLSILVSMIDRVSGPAAKIGSQVQQTTDRFQSYSAGMADLARDGVVLMGTGAQFASAAAAPVRATFETQDALAELSSLGVEELGRLEDAATNFSSTWAGTTKASFLTAAYDIKSGISTLTDQGVADFTTLSSLTAKATKSTAEEMGGLFATGYGIYKDYYSDLSDLEFGEIFSAGIAQSVKQFKTTGSGMTQAISALGASATSAGAPLEEQLAVLGMLQATMSGGEAGTKYTAFLQSAAKAGDELGLSFTDASGKLKSMPEILTALQGKFGDVLTAADKLELQKAFGTQEAVKLIELLYTKTDDLEGNIVTLYDTMGKGRTVAEEMANKINAPPGQSWQVLQQRIRATAETVGNAMLPRAMQLMGLLDQGAQKVAAFANAHPNLISNVFYLVGAFGALLTALGGIKLALGAVGTMITVGTKLWSGLTTAVGAAKYGLFLLQYGAFNLKAGLLMLGKGLAGVIAKVWSFAAALLANPVTWIVVGIIALIAVLILLWKNWDAVCVFLGGTWQAVCDGITGAIDWLRGKLDAIPDSFKLILAAVFPFVGVPLLIIDNWDAVRAFFANLPENIKQGFLALKQWFLEFFGGLGATFFESGGKLISTLADGIRAMIQKPVDAAREAFQKIRNMMPFSDAREGPLSELTLSGRRVFETFDAGMRQTAELPGQTALRAFSGIPDTDPLPGDRPRADDPTPAYPPPGRASVPYEPPHRTAAIEDTTKSEPVRQTIIQQLILKVNMDDIDQLKKLKTLLEELEENVHGDDPTGDGNDPIPAT